MWSPYYATQVRMRPASFNIGSLSQLSPFWTAIPPDQIISRHVEIHHSSSSPFATSITSRALTSAYGAPFSHMSPSPYRKSLALFTFSGLPTESGPFDTVSLANATGEVHQDEWCGNDAVRVTWASPVVLAGQFGDTLWYFHIGFIFAVTEPDGIPIIGPDTKGAS